MLNFKILLIIGFLIISSGAIAGTILLLGAGTGASGGGPPVSCDGTIDLSVGCVQPMLGGL